MSYIFREKRQVDGNFLDRIEERLASQAQGMIDVARRKTEAEAPCLSVNT